MQKSLACTLLTSLLVAACGDSPSSVPADAGAAAADGEVDAPAIDAATDAAVDPDVPGDPEPWDAGVTDAGPSSKWPPCQGSFPKACSVPSWDVISPNLWQNKGLLMVGCGSLWMKTIGISQDGTSVFPSGIFGVRLGPVAIAQTLSGDFSLDVAFRGLATTKQGKPTHNGVSFAVWARDAANTTLSAGIISDVFAVPYAGYLKFASNGYQPLTQNAKPQGTLHAARTGAKLTLAYDPNDGSGAQSATLTVSGAIELRFVLTSPDNQNGSPNPTVETSVEVTGVVGTGAATSDAFTCNSLK